MSKTFFLGKVTTLILNLRLKKRSNVRKRQKIEYFVSVINKTDGLKLLINDQRTTSNAFDDHDRQSQAPQLITNW